MSNIRQTHIHAWQCCTPVSIQLIDEPKFDLAAWLETHAHRLLVDSVHEKFGYRFFIAHVVDQERMPDRRYDLVYFRVTWHVTLH